MTDVESLQQAIDLSPSEAAAEIAALLEGSPLWTPVLADRIDELLIPIELELIAHRSTGDGDEYF